MHFAGRTDRPDVTHSSEQKLHQEDYFPLASVTPKGNFPDTSTPSSPVDQDKDENAKPAANLVHKEAYRYPYEQEPEVDDDTKCEHLPSGIIVHVTGVTRRRRGSGETIMGGPLYEIKSVRAG